MKDLLTIVIPTYNRKVDICRQVRHLDQCITTNGLKDLVLVIVSDNHSEDDTYSSLLELQDKLNSRFEFRTQEKNIGGTYNSRSVLRDVVTPYAMLLGDDDFLDIGYLSIVMEYLISDKMITAIIPNFHSNTSKNCRDSITEDKIYKQGIESVGLMFKAHQMSGIVFKVDQVLETLFAKNGENRYYQTFCIGFNILRGNAVHITRCPLCVNDTNEKFWSYGNDGLWDDMFMNIRILDINPVERRRLERYYLLNYSWSKIPRFIKHPIEFMKSVINLQNMTTYTKWLVIPCLFVSGIVIAYRKKIRRDGVQK